MKDYSQHGEQALILDYFGHAPNGRFLDIGANDGVTFSNTYALFLMGWRGALVDASPNAYKALEANFERFRNKPEIIHAAITTQDGTVTLHESSDTLVSSLSAEAQQTWRHHGFQWTPVQVPGMTVDTLYAVLGTNEFDFVSVDAEGHDLDIVRQLHLDTVKMLCVEYGQHKREIIKACPGFNMLLDNGVNVILAR